MVDRLSSNPADYIVPINLNKLEGRMLHLPAPKGKTRDILLIAGHHCVLERWWSLAENFNDYGSVTMPDLPGFGGMDSFYKIGKKPDIDAYADYLAAFIKLRFRHKRITVVGVSFGFVVITRMLQLYPELTKRIDLLVSIVGFVHKDDLVYSPPLRKTFQYISRALAARPVCFLIKVVFIHKPIVKFISSHMPNSKERRLGVAPEEFDAAMEFETNLWRVNDMRSHWYTTSAFLNVDNCTTPVDLPVVHVYSKTDHYFHIDVVKEHMLIVFSGYKQYIANGSKHHTPNLLADKKEAGILLPPALRRLLDA